MHRRPVLPSLTSPLPPFTGVPHPKSRLLGVMPFTLAGRRASVYGTVATGIDALQIHGETIVRRLRVKGDAGPRDGAGGGDAAGRSVMISPLGVERHLSLGTQTIEERVLVGHTLPAAILEWTLPEGGELQLGWELEAEGAGPSVTCDGRALWVHGPGTQGEPGAVYGSGVEAGLERGRGSPEPDHQDPWAVILVSDPEVEWEVDSDATRDEVRVVRIATVLEAGGSLRLAVAATTPDAPAELLETLEALDAEAMTYSRMGFVNAVRRRRVSVKTPDDRVNETLDWAVQRLEGYRAEFSGGGCVPVVGHGPEAPMESGPARGAGVTGAPDAPQLEAGPDNAGFFRAHDAVWTALAALAAGDPEMAADLIDFMVRHQAWSGQVPSVCSTTGEPCYSGADATPLFLLLVARYFTWTGDGLRVRRIWPVVRGALDFVDSLDHDGDGLPERPEGADQNPTPADPIGGRLTLHETGIWAAALGELAVVAEGIGERGDAERLRGLAERTRMLLGAAFRDPKTGRLASRLERPDAEAPEAERARWRRDMRPTALHAIPVLLGAVEADRADAVDTGIAHPLHTGWVGWTEYVAGRADVGFEHWLRVVEATAPGAVHPDRAVSTAMATAVFVHGVLGVEPDASRHRIRLRPQLPLVWDRLAVERLRMSDVEITLAYRREGGSHRFELDQESGGVPVTVIFEPVVPGRVLTTTIDGQPAELDARPFGTGTLVPVQIVLDHLRTVEICVKDDVIE